MKRDIEDIFIDSKNTERVEENGREIFPLHENPKIFLSYWAVK